MRGASHSFSIPLIALWLLCLRVSDCSLVRSMASPNLFQLQHNTLPGDISPGSEPQPLLPLLAPSPLMPFTNNSVPILSGICALNFSAAETSLSVTATDCWALFAPYLANVICCPQFTATIVILIGQSSKVSGELALNATHAQHCLSDVDQILKAQGAIENLPKMCSIHSSNLTQGSCPVMNVNEIDRMLNSSKVLAACQNIDVTTECCENICQTALQDAAEKIASQLYGNSNSDGRHLIPGYSLVIDDCRSIILRWLANKLVPSSMNSLLRGRSSCSINKECPLVLPDLSDVTKECGNLRSNRTSCCGAMESYLSLLQDQRLITNLQALNCAAVLGVKLQKANVSNNLYNLCHIDLKNFSLQDSGCLLPSLPTDATYDQTYGVSFICDLNDNIEAPWPSNSSLPASSCNKTIMLPSLPKAVSAQYGLDVNKLMVSLFISTSLFIRVPI